MENCKKFIKVCMGANDRFIIHLIDEVKNKIKSKNLIIESELDKWFKDFYKKNRRYMASIFNRNCSNGNLEEAQFLYHIDPDINVNDWDDYAFRSSCYNGHLHIAKWLYGLNKVNIHAYKDHAFTTSCRFGQLESVKWLYELGIDVHVNDDQVIKECLIDQCHPDIFKWLLKVGFDIYSDNKLINKYCKLITNHEFIKIVFDMGYTPLNTSMSKKYIEYKV